MKRLTGLDMPAKRMEQILRSLGFEPVVPPKAQHDAQTVWATKVPSWRLTSKAPPILSKS